MNYFHFLFNQFVHRPKEKDTKEGPKDQDIYQLKHTIDNNIEVSSAEVDPSEVFLQTHNEISKKNYEYGVSFLGRSYKQSNEKCQDYHFFPTWVKIGICI